MKLLNQLLRGIVIGIANIIPGVSGGTMMVSMGIYDTLIYCITHLFSEFKRSILTLLPYLIGMLIGIFALASLLTYCFAHFPLPTSTTFIGLILGGLAPILHKVDKKKVNTLAVLIFIAFFALIIVMALSNPTGNDGRITVNAGEMGILLLMGVIASGTMLIPGVSGSMVLMLMGYYYPVIGAIKNLINALVALDGGAILYNVGILLPFGIGVVIGIFAIAKLIEILLAKWKCITYGAILGLVVASPFAILMGLSLPGFNLVQVIVSVLTFILGFAAAWLLARKDEKPAA